MPGAPKAAPARQSSKPVTKKTGRQVTDDQTTKAANKANDSAEKAKKADAKRKAADAQKAANKQASQRKAGQASSKRQSSRSFGAAKRATGNFGSGLGGSLPGNRLFYVAFFASVAVISWQEIKTFKRMPLPSRFVGAGTAFAMLSILEGLAGEELAGVLAWGLFFGLVYSQYGADQNNGGKVPVVANVSVPSGIAPIELAKATAPTQGGNTPPSTGGGQSAAKKLATGPSA